MSELDRYVDRALHGEGSYFAVDRAPGVFEQGLPAARDRCRALAAEHGGGVAHVFLVGAGGALANIAPLKGVFDQLLTIPSDACAGYELIGRRPASLDRDSLVFLGVEQR